MRVVVTSNSAGRRDQVRPLVLGAGLDCTAEDCVGFDDLPARLAQAPAGLVLVVLDPDRATTNRAIQYAAGHAGAPVLAVGSAAESQPILEALDSGARKFIDVTRFRDELPAYLDRLGQEGAVEVLHGRSIAVLAAMPGSGVTTIASGLAFLLAEKYIDRVALAEIGPGVPELALDLDLEPTHNVADLTSDWERMDRTMLRQALVHHPAGVHVLAHAPETLKAEPLARQAMRHTVVLLRNSFDFSVLDLGHTLDDAAAEALAISEKIVLVVRLDVPSLRLSRELIQRLEHRDLAREKLVLVANRYGQSRQIDWKRAEQALGMPIRVWIPDDSGALNRALNEGLPLTKAARRAAVTRRIDQLARELNGRAR